MKKVLIIAVSCALVTPTFCAIPPTEALELPIKPSKKRSGIHFKVRNQRLKGPKAKNQQIWKDRAVRRPLAVGTVTSKGRGSA